jgi:hypothetical protein
MKIYINHICHGDYALRAGHILRCDYAITDVEMRTAYVDIRPFAEDAVRARLKASYDYLEVRDLPPFDESKVVITWREATIDYGDPKSLEVTRPR